MREYDGAEEVEGYVAEGLVTWEQVCTVEVAEDPVEIFLRMSVYTGAVG
jgi:hypothetical protein